MQRHPSKARRERGQALVEFSIAAIPFLILIMGILDLGRAVYQMNTTSQAAREIARVTSLHPCNGLACTDLGTSTEAAGVIGVQRRLLPSMVFNPSVDVTCIDISENAVADTACKASETDPKFVVVTVRSTFQPATPLTMIFGTHTFSSTTRVELP